MLTAVTVIPLALVLMATASVASAQTKSPGQVEVDQALFERLRSSSTREQPGRTIRLPPPDAEIVNDESKPTSTNVARELLRRGVNNASGPAATGGGAELFRQSGSFDESDMTRTLQGLKFQDPYAKSFAGRFVSVMNSRWVTRIALLAIGAGIVITVYDLFGPDTESSDRPTWLYIMAAIAGCAFVAAYALLVWKKVMR